MKNIIKQFTVSLLPFPFILYPFTFNKPTHLPSIDELDNNFRLLTNLGKDTTCTRYVVPTWLRDTNLKEFLCLFGYLLVHVINTCY